nr:thioesterase family protein [Gordonia araii]
MDIVGRVDQHIADEPYYRPTVVDDAQAGDDGWEYFAPTESSVSVWTSEIQHGGPPTGLLTRVLRRTAAAAGTGESVTFSRIATDILGPVGLDTNRVKGEVIRPGRQISLIGAELQTRQPDGSYRTAATARAWQLHGSPSAQIAHAPRPPMSPLPGELTVHRGVTPQTAPGVDWGTVGFIGSTETAWVDGRTGSTDAVWIRPLAPLVEGEETDFLDSLGVVADVANGVGTTLDPREWTWMNTDTTMHLLRRPVGSWIAIDSELSAGPAGFGATYADLYDEQGFVARTAQTVLLAAR